MSPAPLFSPLPYPAITRSEAHASAFHLACWYLVLCFPSISRPSSHVVFGPNHPQPTPTSSNDWPGQHPDDTSYQPCHRADNRRQSDDAERTARRHSGQPRDRQSSGGQPSGGQPSGTERTNNGSTFSLPQAMAQNGEIPARSILCHGSWQRMSKSSKSTFPATICRHTMTSRAFYAFPATIVWQRKHETGSSGILCHGHHPVITPKTEKTTDFMPYPSDLRANMTEFRGRE
ncbi:hypothetical protein BTIS_0794 [Bifidobacterium tissieri]|uniref:Uncharacterized protein n=1 Tax=Bifidobacterium tissieri TaxID=1630162 RepID=A0A261FHD0_9BIFI|nr:hypothetical protein BTIS_0794 [Bifidobacterium tissieri]